MTATGGQATLVTETSEGCFHPEFSPDGKTIYFFIENWLDGFTGTPKFNLWRVGTDGSHPHNVASSQLFDLPMSSGK